MSGIEPGDRFEIENRYARNVRVKFGRARWLFDLTLTFSFFDGAWVGKGSLQANPTRVFSLAGRRAEWDGTPVVGHFDLTRPPFEPANPTLDGRDNMVPDDMLSPAMRMDWPVFVDRYLHAICAAVERNLGSTVEARAGGFRVDVRAEAFDPMVRMPPPHTWTLKEAEIYEECHDDNAPLRMQEIASHARGLSSEFHRQEYVRPNRSETDVHAQERQANAVSVRLGLGAAGTTLTAYAKAFDRLRFEIGYKDYPLRACRLRSADYRREGGITSMMQDISRNAERRLENVLYEYVRLNPTRPGALSALTTALHYIHSAADHDAALFWRAVALLVANLGLSPSTHPRLQRIASELVNRGVLERSRSGLRGSPDLVLTRRYRAAFQHLGNLEQ